MFKKIIEKPWGHEEIWAKTPFYVGKILHINSGERLSLQHHEEKDETIFILTGVLNVVYGDDLDSLSSETLTEGESFHIPPKTIHRFVAITECDVCEVSTSQLDDIVRHKDDYGRV